MSATANVNANIRPSMGTASASLNGASWMAGGKEPAIACVPSDARSTPNSSAGERQDQSLGQELRGQSSSPGTERGANRELALADGRLRQHQVSDVHARDQQHERHCADERDKGWTQ